MNFVKHWIVVILAIALVACGKSQIEHETIPAGATVVAFGDSVTYGYRVDKQQNYPNRLATMTGWNVVNAGVSGERADRAKNRIGSVLSQYQPKLVIIEIGGNDFLQRRNENAVKEDIRAIIQAVKAADAIPVLVAVPALSPVALMGMPMDSSIYSELGDEEQVVVIQSVFSNVLRNDNLRIDHIHPNAQGYEQLAAGIAEQLRHYGFL